MNDAEQNVQAIITTRDFVAEINGNHGDEQSATTLLMIDAMIVTHLETIIADNPTTWAEIINRLTWEYRPENAGDDMAATIQQLFYDNE